VLKNLEAPEQRSAAKQPIGGRLLPGREDSSARRAPSCAGPCSDGARHPPGNGAVLAPYASYRWEKKLAMDPRRFGKGAIEWRGRPGVANNAGAQARSFRCSRWGSRPTR